LTIRINDGKAVKVRGERPDKQIAVGPTKVPIGFGYEEWAINVDIPVEKKHGSKSSDADSNNRVRIECSLMGMGSGRQKETKKRVEELAYTEKGMIAGSI
jgi:hypothetical protein